MKHRVNTLASAVGLSLAICLSFSSCGKSIETGPIPTPGSAPGPSEAARTPTTPDEPGGSGEERPICPPERIYTQYFTQADPLYPAFVLNPALESIIEVVVDGNRVPYRFEPDHTLWLDGKAQGAPGSIIQVVGCLPDEGKKPTP